MVTTATLELFKNAYYDIYRNMSNFANLSAQNSYYNGLTKLSKQVTFNKIGDSFILDESIENLLSYTYGRILYNDKYFYFQVDDMGVNAQGRTVISYTVDAWETARYQYGMRLGAGTITRMAPSLKSSTESVITGLPIEPRVLTNKPITRQTYQNNDVLHPCIYGLFWSNEENKARYYCHVLNDTDTALVNNMQALNYVTGDLGAKFQNIEILCAFYSTIQVALDTGYWVNANPSGGTKTYYYDSIEATSMYQILQIDPDHDNEIEGDETSLRSTPEKPIAFCDERGNIIYRLPDYVSYGRILYCYLSISGSSGAWDCYLWKYPNPDSSSPSVSEYASFSIPMEPLDIYNDTWATYQAQQRQADIDSRNAQLVKENTTSIGNISGGVIGGAVTGAMAGSVVPGIGTVVGAVGGAIAGAVGSLASSLVGMSANQRYATKEQQILDSLYKKKSDAINLVGSGVQGAISRWDLSTTTINRVQTGWNLLVLDDMDSSLIDDYEDVFGVPCYWPVDDCDGRIRDGPFRADCEVYGAPSAWCAQVQQRLANGVLFS